MKVILLTDIPKVGKKYEVKDFKEGYAQNVLLAKGLVELATPANLGRLSDMKAKQKRALDLEIEQFKEKLQSLKNHSIVIHARANEKGHLFKTITIRDIVSAIQKISGVLFDESLIEAPHIKTIGEHKIVIRKDKIVGEYTVKIDAQ